MFAVIGVYNFMTRNVQAHIWSTSVDFLNETSFLLIKIYSRLKWMRHSLCFTSNQLTIFADKCTCCYGFYCIVLCLWVGILRSMCKVILNDGNTIFFNNIIHYYCCWMCFHPFVSLLKICQNNQMQHTHTHKMRHCQMIFNCTQSAQTNESTKFYWCNWAN